MANHQQQIHLMSSDLLWKKHELPGYSVQLQPARMSTGKLEQFSILLSAKKANPRRFIRCKSLSSLDSCHLSLYMVCSTSSCVKNQMNKKMPSKVNGKCIPKCENLLKNSMENLQKYVKTPNADTPTQRTMNPPDSEALVCPLLKW